LPPEQLAALLASLRAMPGTPAGAHLSDDDLVGYAASSLPEASAGKIDEHLASCADCSTEMERLIAAVDHWRSREGAEGLDALGERIQARWDAADAGPEMPAPVQDVEFACPVGGWTLWPAMPPGGEANLMDTAELPPPPRSSEEGKTEDGLFGWSVETDEAGIYTIRLSTFATGLHGRRIELTVGDLRFVEVLNEIAPDQVGLSVSLPPEMRRRLAQHARPQFRFVEESD
jgi:hypothetical protein